MNFNNAAGHSFNNNMTSEEQLALFTSIINSSDDAIVSNDLDGVITSWNPAAETIFGYNTAAVIGSDVAVVLQNENLSRCLTLFDKVKGDGKVSYYESEFKTKGGELIPLALTAAPLHNAVGKLVGVAKIARNITAQKENEARIKELNDKLEDKVKTRTAELEEANRELEAFNYTVSHDLQTPLRAVSGFAKILTSDYAQVLDEEGKSHLNTINATVKHMNNLIQKLLNFSRMGKTALQKEQVNMHDLVDVVTDEIKKETAGLRAEIIVKEMGNENCDPALLKQVWSNLIGNAVKYSSKKDKPVIEIGRQIATENCPVYYIKDNGAGFDMKYSEKLFGAFQRMHSADEFEGTGVGLATVYRIIARHGGRVWADAGLGKGATFYFTLCKN
jgi:PAS domain S-box-containing protein